MPKAIRSNRLGRCLQLAHPLPEKLVKVHWSQVPSPQRVNRGQDLLPKSRPRVARSQSVPAVSLKKVQHQKHPQRLLLVNLPKLRSQRPHVCASSSSAWKRNRLASIVSSNELLSFRSWPMPSRPGSMPVRPGLLTDWSATTSAFAWRTNA